MRTKALMLTCTALLIAQGVLAQDRISGTWKGEATPAGAAPLPITIQLTYDGKSALTGPVSGFPSPGEVKKGTVDLETGNLKLEMGPTGQPTAMLVFEGTLVNNTATGRVSGNGQVGKFILTKSDVTATPMGGAGDASAAAKKSFAEVSAWVTKAAEMVPADKYTYKPAPTVRTFGQTIGHVTDAYNYYCAHAAGKDMQWSDANEKGPTDKATVVPKLKAALETCNAQYNGAGQIGALIDNVGHTNLHYGNLITYIRMLGMTPPSS